MLSILKEFFQFLFARKKYWLFPIILLLIIFSSLIFLTQGSALAPFMYSIF